MIERDQKLRQNTSVASSTTSIIEHTEKNTLSINFINFKEEIKSLQNQINPNVKYDIRINGMKKMIALINNGIIQNQEFLNVLPFFHAGLVSSISNSRNSSTKIACTLISRLALELHEKFDSLGNFMRPFSSQYAIRNPIIADCCLESMLTIAKSCCTKKILVQLAGLCTSKVPKIRFSASKCFHQFAASASKEIIEDGSYIISKSIRTLLNDPNIEIKTNAKKTAKQLILIDSTNYKDIFSYYTSNLPAQTSNFKISFQNSNNKMDLSAKNNEDNNKNYSIQIANADQTNSNHRKNDYDEIHIITQDKTSSSNTVSRSNYNNDHSNYYFNNTTFCRKTIHNNGTIFKSINNCNIKLNKSNNEKDLNADQIDDSNINLDTHKGIIFIGDSNYIILDSDSSSDSSYISESDKYNSNSNMDSEIVSQSLLNHFHNAPLAKYSTIGSMMSKQKSRKPAPSPINSQKRSSDSDIFSPIQKLSARCSSVSDMRLRAIPLINLSIRQANGHGKFFLENLRDMIEKNDTSEISDIISNILDDVIKCCSLQILAVSAISVLRLLLSRFHNAFEGKLTQLIPTLLNQGAKSSKRASDNAMQLLKELSYYFPPSLLVKATVYSPPSLRLVSFCSFLVDYPTDELFNDATACEYLLHVTLDSYLFDIKSSGHILDVINEMKPEYVTKFLSGIDDKQLYTYQKHFKESHPAVEFPQLRPVNVPEFPDISSIISKNNSDDNSSYVILNWADSFITFVESLHSFQYKMAHTKIFKEINKIMLCKNKCPESIFDLVLYLFQKRGFDDIIIILSGIFKNLRSEVNFKKSQKILIQHFKYCDALTVFSEFTVIMANSDLEISLNAIDFSILLIKTIEKEELIPILPEFTLALSKLLSNERPEIRKGAVLCFVSLFSLIGLKDMSQYTKCLTQAQIKLIMIYLERTNRQKQLQQKQIEKTTSQSEKD